MLKYVPGFVFVNEWIMYCNVNAIGDSAIYYFVDELTWYLFYYGI